MKKTMLVLIIGLLITGVNVYAADGDFIVDGNLGIGTDTPDGPLHLHTGQWTYILYSSDAMGHQWANGWDASPIAPGSYYIWSDSIAGNDGRALTILEQSGNVGIGTQTPSAKLDVLGQARVTSSLDGVMTINGTGLGGNAALKIQGSGTDRFTVLNNGYVGIGTATPVGPLHLHAGQYTYVRYSSGAMGHQWANGWDAIASAPGSYYIWSDSIAENNGRALTILRQSGNIGIGTTTPGAKLDVAGNAHIGGDLTVDGGIQGTFRVDGKIGIGTSSPATGLEISYQGAQSSSPVRFSGLPDADNILMEPFTDTGYEGWKLVASGTHQELFFITDPAYNKIFAVDVESKEVGVGTGDPGARFHVKGDGTATTGGQILISGETDVNDRMWIGFDTTDNYGFIQSSTDGVAEDLVLNADGGNVGIGTVNPEGKLHTEDLLLDLGTGNCPSGYTEGNYGGAADADCLATGIVVKADGSVGIGTATPTEKLYVVGDIYATGEVTWGSSRELKENIRELNTGEALTALNELQPKKFVYKADKNDEHVGFIAEEVPELIATKDRKSLNPMDIIAVLTGVVKEQQRMFEEQRRIMENQQKEMEELKAKVRKLEAKDYMAEAVQ
jgi:hypothetical protein